MVLILMLRVSIHNVQELHLMQKEDHRRIKIILTQKDHQLTVMENAATPKVQLLQLQEITPMQKAMAAPAVKLLSYLSMGISSHFPLLTDLRRIRFSNMTNSIIESSPLMFPQTPLPLTNRLRPVHGTPVHVRATAWHTGLLPMSREDIVLHYA